MEVVTGFLKEVVGDALGELIGYAIVVLIVLVLVIPVYLLMKLFSRRKTTFLEDVQEALHPQPVRDPRRLEIARQMEEVRGSVETVFRYLLYVLIPAVTGFFGWFLYKIRNDPSRQFLQFYFGIGYLLFLCWALTQIVILIRRAPPRRPRGEPRPQIQIPVDFSGRLFLTPRQIAVAMMVFISVLVTAVASILLWGRMPR